MSKLQKEIDKLRPKELDRGELARLIPVTADTNKEARATSIFLATLMTVPVFSKEVLSTIGQRVGQLTKTGCFTEVRFAKEKETNLRPDGLISLKGSRSKSWHAIIEAKIDNAALTDAQVEGYLKLARNNNIDAVLTISNQPVAHPTHVPVKVSGNLLRSVKLYHFSWVYLMTTAQLLLDENEFENKEQRYILSEFVRYMSHPASGVKRFEKMNPEWRDICSMAISKSALHKNDEIVDKTIGAWHQETRDVCHLMSEMLNHPVRVHLSRNQKDDPFARIKSDCEKLAKSFELSCILEVPDAASPLVVTANLRSRVISTSMTLTAPKDKQRASSRVNWLLRQLTKAQDEDIFIQANWPGRTPSIQARLNDVRQDMDCLLGENTVPPISFDVSLIRDIAGKFSGSKKFIEELEDAVPHFYSVVGQRLQAYTPPAPPLKEKEKTEDTEQKAQAKETVAGV